MENSEKASATKDVVAEKLEDVKDLVVETKTKVSKQLGALSNDDAALCSLALGLGSWAVMVGTAGSGAVPVLALLGSVGAVGAGFKGKESKNPTLVKTAVTGVALGTLGVAAWVVGRYWDR